MAFGDVVVISLTLCMLFAFRYGGSTLCAVRMRSALGCLFMCATADEIYSGTNTIQNTQHTHTHHIDIASLWHGRTRSLDLLVVLVLLLSQSVPIWCEQTSLKWLPLPYLRGILGVSIIRAYKH